MIRRSLLLHWLAAAALMPLASAAFAASVAGDTPASAGAGQYRIQPGDVLSISVWKEKDLQNEVLVRPDGGLSFPLAGDLSASGRSVDELRQDLVNRLKVYIPDPVVTVAVKTIGGNQIYVLGKVNRPGQFPFSTPVDVMQALSLAGGTTAYAALNDIVILRRENGQAQALHFHYGQVERGRDLVENVVLRSGDTVVVP